MLCNFFASRAKDDEGRDLSTIIAYSDQELEVIHNYVQWLFPLPEPSAYYSNAPLLSSLEIFEIKNDPTALNGFNTGLQRIRSFYKNTSHWASDENHNLRRITRIIKSTKLICNKSVSDDFFRFIMHRCSELQFAPPADAINYWIQANE